ncbi:hypothetical protein [Pontibacter kalidii]|uniref:hypothetical protein n=1 Tax=Pontibacter kalidii TaxID=2592049 RepID=UPI002252D455|nr:hypothetical protein [Pontibacter kalidii]
MLFVLSGASVRLWLYLLLYFILSLVRVCNPTGSKCHTLYLSYTFLADVPFHWNLAILASCC